MMIVTWKFATRRAHCSARAGGETSSGVVTLQPSTMRAYRWEQTAWKDAIHIEQKRRRGDRPRPHMKVWPPEAPNQPAPQDCEVMLASLTLTAIDAWSKTLLEGASKEEPSYAHLPRGVSVS